MEKTEKRKILIVVAHPDDAELSMGMKIYDHVLNNDDVYIHCLSRGSSDEETCKIREKETIEAGNILGVGSYVFEDIPDTEFVENRIAINKLLFGIIQDLKPDTVYTHYPEDQHLDHRITSEEVLIVAEREVPNIIFFQSPYSKNFKPNMFFLAGDEKMNKKHEAISCFTSQGQFNADIFKSFNSLLFLQHLHHRVIKEAKEKIKGNIYAELFHIERCTKY